MALPERSGLQQRLVALALTLLMVCIWSATHHYRELTNDAALYTVQALARLHPWLALDIYLRNGSQDSYTMFSWFFAKLIGAVGPHQAARSLWMVCAGCFLVAAWVLMRRLADRGCAWLSLTLLMILVGRYGAYSVFRFAEEFLTARSVAETLIVTALACFYSGARAWAIAIAAAALFIHPIMALPGLLLLLCLWAGLRLSFVGALAGICLAGLIAVLAELWPHTTGILAVLDGTWLEVVRERSQFLFLQLWHLPDWRVNALPFASLALTLLAVPDPRMRLLASSAMLVGAAGLCVALIASTIGPAAILMQGQAWRWVWIPSFVSILLLSPTLIWMWRDPRCGPACALLLVGGWTCAPLNIWNCIVLSLLLWLVRAHISSRLVPLLRLTALAIAIVVLAWTLANAYTIITSLSPVTGHESLLSATLHNILGLQTTALLLLGLAWWWLQRQSSPWGPAIVSLVLFGVAVATLPDAVQEVSPTGTPAEISAYADWRKAMPAGSTVAVIGVHSSVGFVWFTLDRSDYLSIDQSAGVVFSRATALEVKRRAEVLEPLVTPSYKVMTYLAKWARGQHKDEDHDLPLTAVALIGVCRDSELDFVIAKQFAGFDPLQHTQGGPYKDWYLYDCHHVRSTGHPA